MDIVLIKLSVIGSSLKNRVKSLYFKISKLGEGALEFEVYSSISISCIFQFLQISLFEHQLLTFLYALHAEVNSS